MSIQFKQPLHGNLGDSKGQVSIHLAMEMKLRHGPKGKVNILPETNSSPLKIGRLPQKERDRLPAVQGRTVSFKEGIFFVVVLLEMASLNGII